MPNYHSEYLADTEDPSDKDKLYVEYCGSAVEFHPNFRLYLVVSDAGVALDTELLTRCALINFSSTGSSLTQGFLSVFYGKENAAKLRDYHRANEKHLIIQREHLAKSNTMLGLLAKTEGSLLDKKDIASEITKLKTEIKNLLERKSNLSQIKSSLLQERDAYLSAANHAVHLYRAVEKLQHINYMYNYSLKWFYKILNTSIENSNKSKVLEKRLRYIKDHLTYTLFSQVTHSMKKNDRLLFAFVLTCQLLVSEGKLSHEATDLLPRMWALSENQQHSLCHDKIPWMKYKLWEFFTHCEQTYQEFKGTYNAV